VEILHVGKRVNGNAKNGSSPDFHETLYARFHAVRAGLPSRKQSDAAMPWRLADV